MLKALRQGSGYVSYLPSGPQADLIAVSPEGLPASFGDVAVRGEYTDILLTGLCQGDEIRLITDTAAESLIAPSGACELKLRRRFPDALFLRLELYRSYAPGLPPMKALLTNPVYYQ